MAVENNLQVSNITFQGTQNTNAASSTSSASKNIKMTDNTAEQELLKRLGITKEQLEIILEKYKDFFSLSPEKQVEIVSKTNAPQAVESTETTTVEQTNATTQTPEKSVVGDDEPDAVKFDNKAYEAASNEEKAKIYAEELAKNKFMYADAENKKTAQDWNALSDTQKQELINSELQGLEKQKTGKEIDSKSLSKMLQLGMTQVQAANFLGISVDELEERGLKGQEEVVHDYIFALPKEKRSAGQQKYMEVQEHKSELLCKYAKSKGVELTAYMAPSEIDEKCKELGVDIIDLEIKDIEAKMANDNLSDTQKKDLNDRLAQLNKTKQFNAICDKIVAKTKDGKFEASGLLEEFDNSDFGKVFGALDSSDFEKCEAVFAYVKTLPKDKQNADTLSNLFMELRAKNPELAIKAINYVAGNSSPELKNAFVTSKHKPTMLTASIAINTFDAKQTRTLAETQEAIAKDEPEFAEALELYTTNTADGERLTNLSDIYAGAKSSKVQQRLGERALDNELVTVDQQALIGDKIAKKSTLENKIRFATNLDKAHKENQISLQGIFCKDKAVNDAMVKDGTYARYATENQLAGLNMHKDRYTQGDYSQQEIDNGLSTLASQIKNCDVSVQSKAVESIVATGNAKATEAAVANLCTAPQVVQDDANLKGILNSAYSNETTEYATSSEIQQKIASGAKLTSQEFYALSPQEKQSYIANYFKSLPTAKQFKILSSLTDVNLKKTIFKRLINEDKNFFRSLVENDANTAEFAYNMHIGEEIVMEVAKRKAASDIKFALLSQKIDADYQKKNSPLASTENTFSRNYTTDPSGFKFDPKEIYVKDKKGNILA